MLGIVTSSAPFGSRKSAVELNVKGSALTILASVKTANNTIKLFLNIFNEFKNSLPQSNYLLLIVYHNNIFGAKKLRFYLLKQAYSVISPFEIL